MHSGILRSLALLLAGAIVGLVGSLLVQNLGFSCWLVAILFIVSLLLVLFGIGTDSLIIHRYHLWLRKKRTKIGILNDMEWFLEDEQIRAWTDISPQVWLQEIEKQAKEKKAKVEVDLIKTTYKFTPYTVIINPYGGVYPEQDLVSFATLDRIFNYIREGGLFVNVADIPGYWAYNPLLRKRTEAAPPVWDTVPIQGNRIGLRALRPFTMVPWMQRLGLKVLNIENVIDKELNIRFDTKFEQVTGGEVRRVSLHRVAVLEENVEAVHQMSMPDEFGQPKNVTSVFLASYGDGSFLISLVFITAQEESVKQELKRILVDLTLSKVTGDLV